MANKLKGDVDLVLISGKNVNSCDADKLSASHELMSASHELKKMNKIMFLIEI